MAMTREDWREAMDEKPRSRTSKHPFYCGCYSCLDDRGEVDVARPGIWCPECGESEVEEVGALCDRCETAAIEDEDGDRRLNEEREATT